MIGRTITHYTITGKLGQGGMGEVYRATDTKLKREVALKVLPDSVARDQERLSRFTREAHILASLNHPNIAAIHGFEESDSHRVLVLELIEGETLEQRAARGPIPLGETLKIALQIAEALEAAHGKGIIHRDLKPANVKVTPEGQAKVLDFGLAKALEPEAGPADPGLSQSSTITGAPTGMGTILGTPAYMAPEQACGEPVDKRADIWAFGCVLYEMLTGRGAFRAEGVSSTLAQVIKSEPAWSHLPENASPPVRRILQRCLEKDPHRRLRDIGEARILLEDMISGRLPDENLPPGGRGKPWGWIGATAASVLALAATLTALVPSRTNPNPGGTTPLKSEILLDAEAPLSFGARVAAIGYDAPTASISRDGHKLVYVARVAGGTALMLRDMTTGIVTQMPGTEGVVHAAFSPDGRSIAFLTNDRVKRTDLDGSGVVTLCEAQRPVLVWWPRGGFIYFTEDETWRLSRVAANETGGKESVAAGGGLLVFSDVLPGGHAALVSVRNGIGGDFSDIHVLDVSNGKLGRRVSSGYGARFVPPGFILFGRSGNLMAVPFNPSAETVAGQPKVVAEDVAMDSLFSQVHAVSSDNGLLAYATGGDLAIGRLAWVDRIDRGGQVEYLPDKPRLYGAIDLSPDGSRLAVQVGDVQDYIWISEIGGRRYRMQSSGPLGWPLWSPDGHRLVVRTLGLMGEPGGYFVREPESRDAGPVLTPLTSPIGGPASWSPAGDVLAINEFGEGWQSYFARIDEPERGSPFEGNFPHFSPDGRFVAYASSRGTSASAIYIRSYPDGRVSAPFSLDGGIEPLWNAGTGELFYRKGAKWYGAKVTTDPELRWGDVRLVFDTDFIDTPGISYDVSPDGKRLLVVKRAEPIMNDRLHLLLNWPAAATDGR